MWDDTIDLALEALERIIDGVRGHVKKKNEKKRLQEEKDERQRQANRERPL